jgi:hypothetical protein
MKKCDMGEISGTHENKRNAHKNVIELPDGMKLLG